MKGGVRISHPPKLAIKIFGSPVEDVYELEQARYFLDFENKVVVVEGREVHSYDELVQIVGQEKYKNKELVEVMLLPVITGG